MKIRYLTWKKFDLRLLKLSKKGENLSLNVNNCKDLETAPYL